MITCFLGKNNANENESQQKSLLNMLEFTVDSAALYGYICHKSGFVIFLRFSNMFFKRWVWFTLALFLTPVTESAMGMFSELVLFSELEGVVLKQGVPVAGAEIVQEVTYEKPGKALVKTVQTSTDGRFRLARVTTGAGLSRILPGQPSILQRIIIRHNGTEYEGWRHNKNSYDLNSELDGRPLKLICELATAPDFEGKHYGICRVAPE